MINSYILFLIPAINLSFSYAFFRKNSSNDSEELNIFEEMNAIENKKINHYVNSQIEKRISASIAYLGLLRCG